MPSVTPSIDNDNLHIALLFLLAVITYAGMMWLVMLRYI